MRVTFSATVAAFVIILMAIALVWGAALIGGPPALQLPPEDFDQQPDRLEVLLIATDQAVTMLTTLALGLVVLVGFSLRLVETRSGAITFWDKLAGVGFVCALFASVFYGFASRRLAFELTNSRYSDWSWVQDTINGQALGLGVSAVFGFYLAARSLERMRDRVHASGSPLQDAKPPSPQNPAATSSAGSGPAALGNIEGHPAMAVAKPRREGGVRDA